MSGPATIHNELLRPLPLPLQQMYSAAEKGDYKLVSHLLKAGTPVNFIDPTSTDSPLMVACRRGFADIVRLCLDYGAKNDPHPDYGQTALHASIACGQYGCAAVLLEVAAESEADELISNLADQYGQTPLHCAVSLGSVPLTELLIQHGARLSSVDTYGQTPLHTCSGSTNTGCLAVLLDHGGDEIIDIPDVYGNTALHHAAFHGRLQCVRLLLETAANASLRNAKNMTPYNLAVTQGHHQIGLLLMEYRENTPMMKPFASPIKQAILGNAQRKLFNSPQPINGDGRGNKSPMMTRYESNDYATPYNSEKGFGDRSRELTLGMPDAKRSHSHHSSDSLNLPRPHTINSPSMSAKPGGFHNNLKQTSLSSPSLLPPDVISRSSSADYPSPHMDRLSSAGEDNSISDRSRATSYDDDYSEFKQLRQLDSPLLPFNRNNNHG